MQVKIQMESINSNTLHQKFRSVRSFNFSMKFSLQAECLSQVNFFVNLIWHFTTTSEFSEPEFFFWQYLIYRNVLGISGPMRSLNAINSIDNNQNIVWDKGAYSLITRTRSYYIASRDFRNAPTPKSAIIFSNFWPKTAWKWKNFWTKLTYACKTKTLGSLYSHALLI